MWLSRPCGSRCHMACCWLRQTLVLLHWLFQLVIHGSACLGSVAAKSRSRAWTQLDVFPSAVCAWALWGRTRDGLTVPFCPSMTCLLPLYSPFFFLCDHHCSGPRVMQRRDRQKKNSTCISDYSLGACICCLHSAHTNLSSHTGRHNKQVFHSAAGNAKYIYSEKNYNNSTFTPATHPWPIFPNCAISLFIPFTSVDTIHSFHVRGHYSFLSRPWTLFIPFTSVDTIHSFHFLFLGDRSLNPITSLRTWVPTSPVVSTRLIPSDRACLGMPAHHAYSTYVLSLHPRFNLWSQLLPSTSTKVTSTIVSCDLQSRLLMLLYSGLPIAELTRTSLTNTWNRGTRGTEEHVEQRNTRNTRNTRSTRWSQNKINAKAPNSGVERNTICYNHYYSWQPRGFGSWDSASHWDTLWHAPPYVLFSWMAVSASQNVSQCDAESQESTPRCCQIRKGV